MRPSDSRYVSPRSTTMESLQPPTVTSTGSGHFSGCTTTSQSTRTEGCGKETRLPSASWYVIERLTSFVPPVSPV